MVKPTTIKLLPSLVISSGWVIKQLDVHNAFLNGSLSETVYMKQPLGYIDKQFPNHVCSGFIYVIVYVDDILVMGNDQGFISSLLTALSSAFKIRDLGELGFFLGIETIKCKDEIFLSQQRYMTDILKRAGMTYCKPLATHMSAYKPTISNANLYDDATRYRSLAGALQYLTVSRLDLSFALNQLCQHMHAPTVSH
ncbi:PREDICTED: uncharacterized protein LOC109179071 [Ipomoea nil]|uniref:uncharacterized protein LOC109179071 n=1 Tax=Ipomoea nil TaxID=35883 RepID=UPI0009019FF6|nr:PREDICTED: uncharacterized protein LOC109179071 [Ipomoea nil]